MHANFLFNVKNDICVEPGELSTGWVHPLGKEQYGASNHGWKYHVPNKKLNETRIWLESGMWEGFLFPCRHSVMHVNGCFSADYIRYMRGLTFPSRWIVFEVCLLQWRKWAHFLHVYVFCEVCESNSVNSDLCLSSKDQILCSHLNCVLLPCPIANAHFRLWLWRTMDARKYGLWHLILVSSMRHMEQYVVYSLIF